MKDEANLTFSHNLESVSSVDGMRFQREKFCPRIERAKKFFGKPLTGFGLGIDRTVSWICGSE